MTTKKSHVACCYGFGAEHIAKSIERERRRGTQAQAIVDEAAGFPKSLLLSELAKEQPPMEAKWIDGRVVMVPKSKPNRNGDAFTAPKRHGGLDIIGVDLGPGYDRTAVFVAGRKTGKTLNNMDVFIDEVEGDYTAFATPVTHDARELDAVTVGAAMHEAAARTAGLKSQLTPEMQDKMRKYMEAAAASPFRSLLMGEFLPYTPPLPSEETDARKKYGFGISSRPGYPTGLYGYAREDAAKTAKMLRDRAAALNPIMSQAQCEAAVAAMTPAYLPKTRNAFEDEED